jgi:uncharacterized protein
MPGESFNPRLAAIQLHPIKSLDPVSVNEARIGLAGGLEFDRVWTLHPAEALPTVPLEKVKAADTSAQVKLFNGKRTPAMHRIRAVFSPSLNAVTLSAPGDERNVADERFAFPDDTKSAGAWFTDYFERPIVVLYTISGFPDDTIANGPTIISTATLERICEWFPPMTLNEARRRCRTTLELAHVPAFWEDQLFNDRKDGIEPTNAHFCIGDVNFEGSNPCSRCSVPTRDSYTGAEITGFQKRFADFRRAQLPVWSPVSRFDHYYRIATNTVVGSSESGKCLRVGDELQIVGAK